MGLSRVLAVDCGGSRSSALLISSTGELLGELTAGPANLHTEGPVGVAAAIAGFAGRMPEAEACAVAAAGVRTDEEREELVASIRSVGVSLPLSVFSDSEAALRAAGLRVGVVVIGGTGSSAFALGPGGRTARSGGWGPRLGDEGGAYWIACTALRQMIRAVDEGDATGAGLLYSVLEGLDLHDPVELRRAASDSSAVARVASLVPLLAAAARRGNPVAVQTFARASEELARLAVLAASHAGLEPPIDVVLAGGLVRAYESLGDLIAQRLPAHFEVDALSRNPAWGAFWLALEKDRWLRDDGQGMALTEQHDPRTTAIDRLPTSEMLRLMNAADAEVPATVRGCLPDLARLVDETAVRMRRDGRLVYVGAGTSGRLAMLDAVECVPTFGVDPGRVVALIAGGDAALTRAVEGAEDDAPAGRTAIDRASVSDGDVVVGVSASGSASYVTAALHAARERGAFTALVTCNPAADARHDVDVPIVAAVGPEVIAGSTRLRAGTAQKLILNMLSTAVMIRLGRTTGNRMSSMRPTNRKLRSRAVRLVAELARVGESQARDALGAASWSVDRAVERVRHSVDDGDTRKSGG